MATEPRPDCYCIDLCGDRNGLLAANGVHFVGRIQSVEVSSAESLWVQYLNAVYNGRTRLPFLLGRLTAFYLHTPAWRTKHPGAPNPFRDCLRRWQGQCGQSECGRWHAELRSIPQPVTSEIVSYQWPMGHWESHKLDAELRLIQIFSANDASIGHQLGEAHEWIEIIRSDARPYFEEGLTSLIVLTGLQTATRPGVLEGSPNTMELALPWMLGSARGRYWRLDQYQSNTPRAISVTWKPLSTLPNAGCRIHLPAVANARVTLSSSCSMPTAWALTRCSLHLETAGRSPTLEHRLFSS